MAGRKRMTLVDRFMQYVSPEPTSGCWLWTGQIDRDGYGKFNWSEGRRAHRASLRILTNTPIPPDMHVDHLCRVRSCVNPAHLEPVTPAENVRRAWPANKPSCKNGHALTPENIRPTRPTWRRCIACNRERTDKYQRKMKALREAA